MAPIQNTMGRYAFFNTDFEYKFRFGVQKSADMRSFGGRICHEKYDGGDLYHEWDKKDIPFILEELNGLRGWLGIEPIQFEKYEKTLEGTQQLSLDLYKLLEGDTKYTEETVVRFRLGSLIYHQLMYIDKLTVQYET
jgi:hypothetical protein